jgi:MFS family permease
LTLALTVFLSGLAISPVFITAFGLIERRAPASMLTEGITWAVVGIGIGMALGAFVAGWVVDVYGARSGFYVGIAAGAAALSTVLLAQGALARERSATLPLPVDQPAE